MKNSRLACLRFVSIIATGALLLAAPAYATSLNVAVINSTVVSSGGSFPTTTSGPTGAFTSFNFTNMPVGDVSLVNLAGFDTVLLNMHSSGMNCNSGSLAASQQADLVSFVSQGGKLIIYDSECSAVDYSWLPYPFTTTNPGALGATGTLVIEEETDLARSNPVSQQFIDTTLLATQTDAAGDMNVMRTRDAHWCLSMTGTNAIPATGPVLAYAGLGPGLIVWNGLDQDDLSSSTSPDAAAPEGNLAKLWLQELQATASSLPTASCKTVVPRAAEIPTLTQWGTIIMSLLLAGFAVLVIGGWRRV